MPNRVGWIDAVRGGGIVLVLLGHMQIPELVDKVIFSFHMPLFFFLSGYLFKDDCGIGWLSKKVDGLIIPYMLYGVIALGESYVIADGHFSYWLRSGLQGNGVGLTWFFMCLFMAEILGAMVILCVRRLHYSAGPMPLILTMFVLAIIAYINTKLTSVSIMMSRSFLAAAVFWLGGYICLKFKVIDLLKKRHLIILLSILPALFFNGRIDMACGNLGSPLITYPVAFSLILAMIVLIKAYFFKNRALIYIGCHSLLFMMWHSLLPPITKHVAFLMGIDVNASILIKVVQRVVNLALVFAMVWCLDRWVVCFTGRWRPISCVMQSLTNKRGRMSEV